MTENKIQETIRAFGDVTKGQIKAGFDGVELHGAHGFLLQNFFSLYLTSVMTDGRRS